MSNSAPAKDDAASPSLVEAMGLGRDHDAAPALRRGPAVVLAAVGLCMLLPSLLDRMGPLLGVSSGTFRDAVVAPFAVASATAAAYLLASSRSLTRLVGWPSTGWEVAGLFVAFAAVMWLTLGGLGIASVLSQVFDLGWRLPSSETGAFVAGDRAWYLDLVSFIYSNLGGPWAEELLYRFLALRGFLLLGVTPGGAVVASAALFAVGHLPLGAAVGPIALASYFSLGLATGALTWWTGRLAPALFAHIAFNLMFTLAA